MNFAERRKSRPECRFDRLESRELLNAHFGHPEIAHGHFAQAYAHTPQVIKGTLSGNSSYTTDPLNSETGGDTYSLSGRTSAGQAGLTGTDTWAGTIINPSTEKDLYFAGDWTMTMSNGSAIKIAYTGSGISSTSSTGPWNEKLTGTAVGITGSLLGKKFQFSAFGQGNFASTATTFKISLTR